MDDFGNLLNVVDTLGTLALLVWLVVQGRSDLRLERANHEETRKVYRSDLRDIAGISKSLAPKE